MIIREMMEAVSFSETSVSVYRTTRRNIPEDSHFRTKFYSEDLSGVNHLEDIGIDLNIILKYNFDE
jgi:hypothetical protein